MNDVDSRNLKIALSIAAILVVTSLIMIFMLIYTRTGRKAVTIVAVPSDAAIDSPIGKLSQGERYLPYGEYDLTISREGFKTVKKSVKVDGSTSEVFLSTLPNSKEGEKFLEDNPKENLRYEIVGGSESQRVAEVSQELYPFIKDLPYTNFKDNFVIHYGVDEQSDKLAFFVIGQSSTNGRKKAIQWLQKNGVDISVTDIRYEEFTSPLKKEVTIEDFRS